MKTQIIRIDGMTCANCRNRIEKKLNGIAGIEQATADFSAGTATVAYDPAVIAVAEIRAAIESLGYAAPGEKQRGPAAQILGTLVIILALYMLLRRLMASELAAAFPLAEAGMGYGMVFVIGLVTSVHCIAMCGGINLSQCLQADGLQSPAPGSCGRRPPAGRDSLAALRPATLYNAGRMISYTAVGIVVGALGSAITVSGRFQGAILLAAGVFMILMGLNMFGAFPALRRLSPRLPAILAKRIDEQKTRSKNPLIIGFLNGFMPCGPLQAMQLYALSTASPVAGGISMFLFCLGTVPLAFGLGALSSALSQKFARKVLQGGAILVTALGLVMFANGWNLAGLRSPADAIHGFLQPMETSKAEARTFEPVVQNGVQIVNSTLSPSRYPAIVIQQGIPVKWTISAPQGSINGCNNRMFIREYGIEHSFRPGDNVIEFTPERTGRFSYSCWMGMIRSTITVVAENGAVADLQQEPDLEPAPAGVTIPAGAVAVAAIQKDAPTHQRVAIDLREDGFSPSVLVLQKGIPAVWKINNNSLDPGNSKLIVPAYYSQLDMQPGDNQFQLMPDDDFDFSTGDHVFYGYVKVVDDLESIDLEAIKKEVSEFETRIYPEAYFEEASGGCACCR